MADPGARRPMRVSPGQRLHHSRAPLLPGGLSWLPLDRCRDRWALRVRPHHLPRVRASSRAGAHPSALVSGERRGLALALLVTLAGAGEPAALSAQDDPALARARRLLAATPLIDGHNDLVWEIRTSPTAPRDVAAYDLRTTTPGQTDLA